MKCIVPLLLSCVVLLGGRAGGRLGPAPGVLAFPRSAGLSVRRRRAR